MTDLTSTTPSQDRAIDVLIAGGTQLDAADAAGVTRQTVSVWCNQHPGFCASLNARRHELIAKRIEQIRGMDIEALAVIAAQIASGNITVALARGTSRQFHTVDVTDIGSSRAESLMNARADEVRKRPEHAGSLAMLLTDGLDDQYTLPSPEARRIAEKELVELLEAADG